MTTIRLRWSDEPMAAATARTPGGGVRVTAKVVQYVLRDVMRGRWLLAYAGFFLLATEALARFGGPGPRVLLSLANIVLLVAPLVGVVFGTMYLYNAREFNELLLAQPVRRRQLFAGLYLGLAVPLSAALALGLGLPLLARVAPGGGELATLGTLLLVGVGLTFVFVALAFLIAVRVEDRVRGLGVAVAVWLAASVLFDGAVLLVAAMFADYPLEGPMLALMLLNPVDLARVTLLLQFDVAALMGYTGAVFERFFGSALGLALSAAALTLWIAAPLALGERCFRTKDF